MACDRETAIRELRKLVEGEQDLYVGTNDDKVLLHYLSYANNDVEKAFEKMKVVFRLKEQYSEFYAFKRDPEVHDVLLKKGIHLLLENRDQLGRRIYVLRLKYVTYGEFEPHQMFQTDDLWLTLAVDEEETQQNGLVIIMDLKDMSWKLMAYFTPHIVRASTAKAENVPLRHIQYHIINAGFMINAIVKIVFPFLSQATKEAIFFHKSNESLHEFVSPSALPKDYGGLLPPLNTCHQEKLVREYLDKRQNRLTELLSYGYRTAKT